MSMQQSAGSRLLDLPEELIEQVLTYLPWPDIVACNTCCRLLRRLADECLEWRHHFFHTYRYFEEGEAYAASLRRAPPANVQWKKLFSQRKAEDRAVNRSIDDILSSQTGRLGAMHHIMLTGYNARDNLQQQLGTQQDAEDYLSRTYWSSEILGAIERSKALEEWIKLANGEPVPLERALAVFDAFVCERPPLTLDETEHHLDAIADRFRAADIFTSFEGFTSGDKARLLSRWLRAEGITGLDDDNAFRDFRNVLIGVSLCEKDHPSLPLISVAVFCAIAKRLGLDAHPCPYPVKVMAVVNVSDTYPGSSDGQDSVYLDPHDGTAEFALARLKTQLSAWGIPSHHHAEFLEPAPTVAIVKRVARNMAESLQERPNYADVLQNADQHALALQHLESTDALKTTVLPTRASYAICWVSLIFLALDAGNATPLDYQIPRMRVKSQIENLFPQDSFFLHKFIAAAPNLMQSESIQELQQNLREDDELPKPVKRRNLLSVREQEEVKYCVGQIFTHQRYSYTAAIIGWDPQCHMGEDWIRSMNVDNLPRGRHQPFYQVIVADDESQRYVAEENIHVHPEDFNDMPEGFGKIAGRYFKRFDVTKGAFVSNVRDQYPED